MASASLHVYVVAGVRVSDVFTVKQVEKRTKKFHPDTGVPYEQVTTEHVGVLFGKEYPDLEPNPEEWGKLLGGLEVFDTGNDAAADYTAKFENPYHRYDYKKHFIGVRLNVPYREAGRHFDTEEPVFELLMTPMRDALQKAHEAMRKLGNAVEPKVYVVKSVSY